MIVKLLNEHHLEFLSLKGDCRGSSESTYVKIPHYWKSHALAQMYRNQKTFYSIAFSCATAKAFACICLTIFYTFARARGAGRRYSAAQN